MNGDTTKQTKSSALHVWVKIIIVASMLVAIMAMCSPVWPHG